MLSYKIGGPFSFDAEITNEDHTVTASFKERIGLERVGRKETPPPFKADDFIECMNTEAWKWN